jgi:hypothetical protein
LSVSKVLSAQSITAAATALLDEVLLVLILIEIVHTVVLSLHSHRLVAQPFIIVGLVALIRKILFILSGQKQVSTSLLACSPPWWRCSSSAWSWSAGSRRAQSQMHPTRSRYARQATPERRRCWPSDTRAPAMRLDV